MRAHAQGVKLGDFQATLMGMLSAALFFVISHAKPLDALSAQRPHPNIFSPYVFLSLLGQFAAHMAYLVYMYTLALAAMPKVGFIVILIIVTIISIVSIFVFTISL